MEDTSKKTALSILVSAAVLAVIMTPIGWLFRIPLSDELAGLPSLAPSTTLLASTTEYSYAVIPSATPDSKDVEACRKDPQRRSVASWLWPTGCEIGEDSIVWKPDSRSIPAFNDYPAATADSKKPAPVSFNNGQASEQDRQEIVSLAAKGPNFAGHYTLINTGCGTECKYLWIVDAKTGEVYEPHIVAEGGCVFRSACDGGFGFQVNSNLLIENPYIGADQRQPWPFTTYYVWEHGQLQYLGEVHPNK